MLEQQGFFFNEALSTGKGSPRSVRSRPSVHPNVRQKALRLHGTPVQIPLPLPESKLFVDEGARQVLERRLSTHLVCDVQLSITDNRRTMIASRQEANRWCIRLHHMFLDMDPFTLQALARYFKRGDRNASALLGRYIEAHQSAIRSSRKRPVLLEPKGQVFDLKELYDQLNHHFFDGTVHAHITWGRFAKVSRRRKNSIKLGSYSAEDLLIRIHPVLDQTWVPRYFVEFVIYHEMLHHVIRAPVKSGRQYFHTPEFRAWERRFPKYHEALAWEQHHLARLLK